MTPVQVKVLALRDFVPRLLVALHRNAFCAAVLLGISINYCGRAFSRNRTITPLSHEIRPPKTFKTPEPHISSPVPPLAMGPEGPRSRATRSAKKLTAKQPKTLNGMTYKQFYALVLSQPPIPKPVGSPRTMLRDLNDDCLLAIIEQLVAPVESSSTVGSRKQSFKCNAAAQDVLPKTTDAPLKSFSLVDHRIRNLCIPILFKNKLDITLSGGMKDVVANLQTIRCSTLAPGYLQ